MAINNTQGVTQTQVLTRDESRSWPAAELPVRLPAPNEASSHGERKLEAAQQEARLKVATQQLNDFMKRTSIDLKFSIDTDSKQVVVKVLNGQTGELIRQIPSAEALKLAKAMDTLQGLIIQKNV